MTSADRDLAPVARPAVPSRVTDDAWVRPAFLGIVALAAFVYLRDLTISGFGNEYYAMAAQAGSQSWSAWFFGSLDASSFITLDKPPLTTMLIGLSVRVLGLSPLAVMLPQAFLGIATVALLLVVVRRSFGPVAATIAGVVMALTPVAALIFRYDNPDAVLTFLLVAAAGTLLSAIESGRRRWLVAAGALVGAAFLTKFLQAPMVLPGFALTYLVAARGSARRRVADICVFGLAALVASAWWVVIVEIIPAPSRPYVGGSSTDSVVDLIFGGDGFGRLLGRSAAPGPAASQVVTAAADASGSGPGGVPGLLRMFNDRFAGGIAWLLPFALVSLVVGVVARWRAVLRDRHDSRFAGYLLWGSWLLVHLLVFSFMSGTIHEYYTVVIAPAVAALVGAGTVEMWGLRSRYRFGGLVLAGTLVGSAIVAVALLGRVPDFLPGLGMGIVGVTAGAAIVVAAPADLIDRRIAFGAIAVGLVALLAAPTVYTAVTVGTAYSGGDPHIGPAGNAQAGGGGGGAQPGGRGQGGGPGQPGPTGGQGGPAASRPQGGQFDSGMSQALIDYLVAQRGSARWLVAVNSANVGAPIQLATGIPVMAVGGFKGDDATTLTLAQLKAYVAAGDLRFVAADLGGGQGDAVRARAAWITASCAPVTLAGSVTGVYDCRGPTAGS